jgi:hypothetical protein
MNGITYPLEAILTNKVSFPPSTTSFSVSIPFRIASSRPFNERLGKLAKRLMENGWSFKFHFHPDGESVSQIDVVKDQERKVNVKNK